MAYVLRPHDQRTIAVLVAAALFAVSGYWFIGAWRHGWLEWDRAEPQPLEFLVRVNAASWPELAELPDLGETLAKRIVEHREQHGRFRDVKDLLSVPGIGPKKLAGIRPHVVFD